MDSCVTVLYVQEFLSRTQFACILIHTQNEEVSMSDTSELSLKETPQ